MSHLTSLDPRAALTAAEAAFLTGRSTQTIRRAYRAGHLVARKQRGGTAVTILAGDLADWMMGETYTPTRGAEAKPTRAAPMPAPRRKSPMSTSASNPRASAAREHRRAVLAARRAAHEQSLVAA